jgi:polyhydroxyalkanoate synthesis repressor PhaR
MRTIKRYANRKLYDTTEKRYVTLKEVSASVRKGDDVLVVDHVTNRNLTVQTLVQAVYEEEKVSPRFAVETLVAVIRGVAAA